MTPLDREPQHGDRLRDMRKGEKGVVRVVDFVHAIKGSGRYIRFVDYAVYEKDWHWLLYEKRIDRRSVNKKVERVG